MNKIMIASVLKPLNDTRAFNKLGLSLCETNKYHLNIIGFFTKYAKNLQNLKFTPIYAGARLSPKRLMVSKNFIKELKEYQPDILIVTTYELLPAAIWGKKRYKYKLIYDVQENYSLNVKDHQSLPYGLHHLVAGLILCIEKLAAPYVDHFLLAENKYQYELPFIAENFTVLQNKFEGESADTKPFRLDHKKSFNFLISGTLTPAYGIEEAVIWFKEITRYFPGSKLTIMGHVTLKNFYKKLKKLTMGRDDIYCRFSLFPISHSLIMEAYDQADIILLPYQQSKSIRYKIPTKLFEALAKGKPVLYTSNPLWTVMVRSYPAGASVDFMDVPAAFQEFQIFLNQTFYVQTPSIELTWEYEKQKWISLVDQFLK